MNYALDTQRGNCHEPIRAHDHGAYPHAGMPVRAAARSHRCQQRDQCCSAAAQVVESLRGNDDKIRIVLNKSDQAASHPLIPTPILPQPFE